MFDGNGKLIELEKYISYQYDYAEEDEEEYLKSVEGMVERECDKDCEKTDYLPDYGCEFISYSLMKIVCNTLYGIIANQKADISKFTSYYYNNMICVNIDEKSFAIWGDRDGPYNGCDPKVFTNMFDMEEEKDYFLYIDNMFYPSSREPSSELFIDLKKVSI